MRTVLNLRDDLVERARQLTGLKRKVDIVNEALRVLVKQGEVYRSIRKLRGKIHFRGTSAALLRERHGSHR